MEVNHRLGFCVWPITNDAKFAMVYHKNYVIMMPFPLDNWEWTKVLLEGKNGKKLIKWIFAGIIRSM